MSWGRGTLGSTMCCASAMCSMLYTRGRAECLSIGRDEEQSWERQRAGTAGAWGERRGERLTVADPLTGLFGHGGGWWCFDGDDGRPLLMCRLE